MPTKKSHLDLAKRNGEMLAHLLERIDQFPEWTTTVAFYRALHLVEAAFAIDEGIRHGGDHGRRNRLLKNNRKYAKIYEAYRPLWAASLVARYLECDEQEVSCFSEYLKPDVVRAKIINHYLKRIESSVELILGEPIGRIPNSD